MNKSLFNVAAITISLISMGSQAGQIAITFDDAPTRGSRLMSGEEKTQKIIQHLKDHQVKDALFFVTTNNIENQQSKDRLKALTDAGFHLAHHSHMHSSATRSKVKDTLADFDKADEILKEYDNFIRLHRFPMLHYGATQESRREIREHIYSKGYKIGYVTVDNFDWYISAKLVRAHHQGKKINYPQLKKLYVDVMWQAIQFYDERAKQTLNRSPKHTLLLHENEAAALFLGDLLAKIKKEGWEIITPQQAYKDPIADVDLDKLSFNKQGRIAAIAHQKGVDKKQLRHPAENTDYLDKLFVEYKVIED